MAAAKNRKKISEFSRENPFCCLLCSVMRLFAQNEILFNSILINEVSTWYCFKWGTKELCRVGKMGERRKGKIYAVYK